MNLEPSLETRCPSCGTATRLASDDALCPGCLLNAALNRGHMSDEETAFSLDECDGYTLEKEIGRGGYGVVFLAHRAGSLLPYALKMLASAQLAGPDEIRRFRFEAESVFQLSHRHIVRVVDIGDHQGAPYFVMDYAEGGNLAEKLDQSFDPNLAESALGDSVQLTERVARAVHFAHDHGVLHRDLKPANILIDRHGEPLVSDFGLARFVHTPSGVTMTGATLGTPSYMSPEQATGSSVTTATDLFSLGVMLFQQLTGRLPFTGDSAIEILRKVTTEDAPDPRTFAPWIDRDLAMICLTALRREPSRRYATVAMFADDLERWQRGEPVLARPISNFERMVKWSRRHPVSATFGLTGGVAVIGLVSLYVTGSLMLRDERNNALKQKEIAEKNEQAAKQSEKAATAARDEFQINAYAADIYLAFRANADGHLGQARQMLARHLPGEGKKDLRGFEWYALDRLCRGDDVHRFQDHRAAVMAVAFDPSGKSIASAGRDGRVVVRSVATGDLLVDLPLSNAPQGVAEIPLLANVTKHSAEISALVMNAKLNPDELRMRGSPSKLGEISCLAWTPDGTKLLTGGQGNYVRLWSMPDGTLQGLIPSMTTKGLSVSADGESIFVFRSLPENALRHELRIYRLADLSLVRVIESLMETYAVSADGSQLAVMPDGGNRIVLYSSRDGLPICSVDQGFPVKQLAFSADGKVLFGAEQSGIMIASWRTSDGQRIGSVFPIGGKFARFLPLPGGAKLASTGYGQTLAVQAIAGDSAAVLLRGHEDSIHALASSADGQWLASGGNDQSCRIWRTAPSPPQEVGQAEFDPEPTTLPETIPWPKARPAVWARSPQGYWVGDGKKEGSLRLYPHSRDATPRDFTAPSSQYSRLLSNPNGLTLGVFAWPRSLQLLDVASGKWSEPWNLSDGTVGPIVFSPDGTWLASGGDDNAVTIRSRKDGVVLAVLRGHQGRILDLAISPDGRTLASSSDDATLRLWHVATWRDLGNLHQLEIIDRLMFSKSGDVLRCLTTGGQVRDFGGSGR